ncbi:divalent-cation tolerance protein CutA [Streptomyces cinnamoneus]|uniref:Divalent-cation tolerance protein CutA n=1 Tax=Streptomyces cinnamoneus TaxID=53446 RepID=A0A2G1XQ61_STRCJ|nr:divalent-cation tolerance protein CutA [Streptomyces cinnamoneus]PHQ49126.1 divalent-cation tolerance protein CutA [Streptomyces cinnamoneus]PHQ53376.1 divalent-cation tolerance protein CutA [Streptomyces cinnamoneus]PHQ53377.1 divalent-cation tolerance protein CutA [Streptomyces cinnamoneus]PPT15226.1 divalent-cation tolerance protein CutA [Streptomyces cinnamoneus]
MPEPEYVTVMTTTDSEAAARHLAQSAVERRVAACAQIDGPVTSVYRWEGRIETAAEWRVLFKATAACYAVLEAHVTREHPYDVPEIIALPVVAGSDAYLAWLRQETAQ